MRLVRMPSFCKRMKLSGINSSSLIGIGYISLVNATLVERIQAGAVYSTLEPVYGSTDKDTGKMTLAKNLAFLMEESSNSGITPMSRTELKRLFELRIKKRVKEQYANGKFHDLMVKVIASPKTLEDAYNCIRINSNVDLASDGGNISFESMAEELLGGSFNVNANTFPISTRDARKEVLILPNLKLKVVQEAIRIVLEVVYRPQFSKISHGCRSGKGHTTALKYISKEISSPDWWFTMLVSKKLDASVLAKLISTMEDNIEDPNLYAMIQNMFDAQVLHLEFGGFPKGHGLPQEGVLSPILMNIYLDLLDHEFYRMSIRYEALDPGMHVDHDKSHSRLRSWFRRQLKGNVVKNKSIENCSFRVHSCRFMDEIFFAFSGSKDIAIEFKNEILNYMQNSLHLDVSNQSEILPYDGHHGIQFLGTLVKANMRESPAVRAVHKLKEKVRLFASQRQEAWDAGMVQIGKKWLAHGLKKVKESEIKHLADTGSVLHQISCFRKVGMETDHWYKLLLKIWLQDVNAKAADNERVILSKYITEPVLPKELRDSFYEFQKQAQDYVASETASLLALLPNSSSCSESVPTTEILAPVNEIKKRLTRYGLTNVEGYPCTSRMLILQDKIQIIDWFSGLTRRWLMWYRECNNFSEVKLLISDQVRKSCIRTLAAKYRLHETEIEKRFDAELCRIPSTLEIEQETQASDIDDEALMYGISYSGLCLLSLARMVSRS